MPNRILLHCLCILLLFIAVDTSARQLKAVAATLYFKTFFELEETEDNSDGLELTYPFVTSSGELMILENDFYSGQRVVIIPVAEIIRSQPNGKWYLNDQQIIDLKSNDEKGGFATESPFEGVVIRAMLDGPSLLLTNSKGEAHLYGQDLKPLSVPKNVQDYVADDQRKALATTKQVYLEKRNVPSFSDLGNSDSENGDNSGFGSPIVDCRQLIDCERIDSIDYAGNKLVIGLKDKEEKAAVWILNCTNGSCSVTDKIPDRFGPKLSDDGAYLAVLKEVITYGKNDGFLLEIRSMKTKTTLAEIADIHIYESSAADKNFKYQSPFSWEGSALYFRKRGAPALAFYKKLCADEVCGEDEELTLPKEISFSQVSYASDGCYRDKKTIGWDGKREKDEERPAWVPACDAVGRLHQITKLLWSVPFRLKEDGALYFAMQATMVWVKPDDRSPLWGNSVSRILIMQDED